MEEHPETPALPAPAASSEGCHSPSKETQPSPANQPDIVDIGITTLWPPQDESAVEADVCFVHGLGGNPFTTWQYKGRGARSENKRNDGSPTRKGTLSRTIQRFSRFGKRDKENGPAKTKDKTNVSCFWPFDFLPRDFDNVRILTYGYDSNPTHWYKGSTTQMTIDQHTQTMLQKISNHRTHCPARPIIFVAHSLGGILVKNMIIESRKYADLDGNSMLFDIYRSCHAIIFFGTPHRGASSAEIGSMVANVVGVLPTGPSVYKGILRNLEPDSEKLVSIMRDFNDILTRNVPASEKIQIYSFQEGKGYSRITIFDHKVVPDGSSIFNIGRGIERNSFIPSNHMDMCRFKSQNDSGYVDFKAALTSYLRLIAEKKRVIEAQREQDKTLQDALRSLDFHERVVRNQQLAEIQAKDETFEWIWNSEFKAWLQSSAPLFWISGKPASGKSTLMHHLSTNRKASELLKSSTNKSWAIVYHFFDFRAGAGLRNSLEGFMRSLVLQLCSRFQECRASLVSQFKTSYSALDSALESKQWSRIDLQSALETALQAASAPIFLFVDGLDEFEGDKYQLCTLLREISSRTKVCVASRPDPPYPDAFHDTPSIKMDRLNGPGILSFVNATLEGFWRPSDTAYRQELQSLALDIKTRAKGVFLWARFAVTEILDGQTRGEEPADLQQRLSQVPDELKDIYRRIFRRRTPMEKETTSRVLLLILCAQHTLTLGQICIALLLTAPSKKEAYSQPLVLPELAYYQTFRKKILASAGGVLETLEAGKEEPEENTPYESVVIIHRTVESYLQQGGWSDLDANESDTFYLPHYLMMRACVRALQEKRAELDSGGLHDRLTSSQFELRPKSGILATQKHKYPVAFYTYCQELAGPLYDLFAYAVFFLPDHAKRFEEETGLSSYEHVKDVLSNAYVDAHMLAWKNDTCRFCMYGNIAGVNGCIDPALYLAIFHGMERFVEESLTPENSKRWKHLERQVSNSSQHPLWKYLQTRIFHSSQPSLNTIPRPGLLQHFRDVQDSVGLTTVAVGAATHLGRTAILKTCLAYDPFIDDNVFRRTLMNASLEVVKILLDYGKTTNEQLVFESCVGLGYRRPIDERLKRPFCFRPLWDVAKRGDKPGTEELIDIFLRRGEEINGQCGPGGTAIHSFFRNVIYYRSYDKKTLEAFLRKGADINAIGPYGTPLEYLWMLTRMPLPFKPADGWKIKTRMAIDDLLELGGVNRKKDPNGRIPTVEEMRAW